MSKKVTSLTPRTNLFTEYFGVSKETLSSYGAFDITLDNDVPLFVDPFHFYYSTDQSFNKQHEKIINYLLHLKTLSSGQLGKATLRDLFQFPEVKYNRLGFCLKGYDGRGPGAQFAQSLYGNLQRLFSDFGKEQVTQTSHLEKLCLIDAGVGRDMISDFTVNITKTFFLEYTQQFALTHLTPNQRKPFDIVRAEFDFNSGVWYTKRFVLPVYDNRDYVLLTPLDLLTADETWISRTDLIREFEVVISSVENTALRDRVNAHFYSALAQEEERKQKEAKKKVRLSQNEREGVIARTISQYPELIDWYIKFKEDKGSVALDRGLQYVSQVDNFFVFLQELVQLFPQEWFRGRLDSYEEAHQRIDHFKAVIEKRDGWKLLHKAGAKTWNEPDVRRMFQFVFVAAESQWNTEVDNGRGPSDVQVSQGQSDVTEIELKLGSNTKLRENLNNQLAIYMGASGAKKGIYVILCITEADERRVKKILDELKLTGAKDVVVIDARADNKPSGSKARSKK